MLNYRLWRGLRQYGWVSRGLVAVAVIMVIFVITEVVDWFDSHSGEPLYAMAIGGDSLLVRLFTYLIESMNDGALNYVTLVLLEVVIYHFMRQALRVILDKDVENAHKFKPFLNAQIRMIQVTFLGLLFQSFTLGVTNIVLPGSLQSGFAVLVESTILGFAVADNYNEQFELKLDQSVRYISRNYLGICIGLGLPLFMMLKVPLFGTILGPLVTSVTAAIVLRERSDLHLVGYQMSPKEKEKAEKKAAKKRRKEERKARKKKKR